MIRYTFNDIPLSDYSRASAEGCEAARQGQPDDPPYPRGSSERSAWLCGWRGYYRDEAAERAWRRWLG